MGEIIVGIADMNVSNNPEDILVTYALGSCIAVAVYDPKANVGGLLHFMLPDSSIDTDKARKNPAMFADTGVPLLFKSCYSLGAVKAHMFVKAVGGASVVDDGDYFRIGQRNITAMRKIFWKNNVMIEAEDTGGKHNRTIRLHISDGRCYVKNSTGEMKGL